MTRYMIDLKQPSGPTSSKTVQVGSKTIEFKFQWAVATAEQLTRILNFFIQASINDPIIHPDGAIDRSYNYIVYYSSLVGKDLNEWLDTNPLVPRSISLLDRPQQITILEKRITRCVGLVPIINQFLEVMRWQVSVTYNGHKTVAVVQPGGWFRNQDRSFAFRFVSALNYIGEEDLGTVAIEFEVYDE